MPPESSLPARRRPPAHPAAAGRRPRWPTAAAVVTVVVLLGGCAAAARVGTWLIVEDPLRRAQAIVVLNGETPDRVQEAIALYGEGWAPEVWLTQLPDSEALARRIRAGEVVDGGTQLNVRLLAEAGVPADRVHVLREPIRNTAHELQAVASVARARGLRSLILVTSAPHTRRARFLWDRTVDTPAVVIRHPRHSRWDLGGWWRHDRERGAIVHEVLGLLAAYVTEPRARRPALR